MGLWFSASAVVPRLTDAWSLDDSGRAWLTMSVQIGFVVGAFASALFNVADRAPTFLLFAFSAFAGALANALIPFAARDLSAALPLRFLTGFFSAGVYPVGMKIMATWCKEDRGLGIGLLVGALTIGSASPHLINALGGLAEWQPVLYASSLLAAIGGVIALLFVREGEYRSATPPFNWKFVARVFQDQGMRLANFGYFGHMWELYAMWTWIPAFLAASFAAQNFSDASRAAAFAAFIVIASGGVSSLIAGIWADKWGRVRVTTISMMISGACAALSGIWFDAAPVLVAMIALIWGAAVVADSAQFSASISELAPREYIGTALTLQTSLGFLLTLVSIRLVPFLVNWMGWRWSFVILAIGPALGVWAMLALGRTAFAGRLANGRG